MSINGEERPSLIQGIGDEVLLTTVAFITALGCAIHFLSRRGYFSGSADAATVAPSSTSANPSARPSTSSSVLGDGLRRRAAHTMEPVVEEEEEEVEEEARERPESGSEGEEATGSGEEANAPRLIRNMEPPEGSVLVTVKYMDDRRREAFFLPSERVEAFKERNFPEEIAYGRWIRIVHRGRELKDHLLMSSFDLAPRTVLHCVVTDHRPRSPASGEGATRPADAEEEAMFEPGQMMFPLFGTTLGLMWVWVLMDRSAFRPSSLVLLLILSAVIVYGVVEHNLLARQTERRRQQEQQQQQQQPPPPPRE